ncbi:MAG: Fis family transcriptional regulator [Henriciella sp.]|jgi:DNA helicase-2/ATP-dependent DNA helicase PcrA|nr:UvrD-helicase domain-containing protein [Henriciella sp.]MAO81276.1 Fis family transcriptional regulator [Nocardioides sp.]MBK74358.1 Fis family transcriptional regulator [Henriciella sp.]|tara:strand:+ start:4270 stop:6147 length:1878 start_codon:yes stop_codon:yes gene_type:complete
MTGARTKNDDTFDAGADEVVQACLSLEAPKSFFLYAGAGSGKTRSLKDALEEILKTVGPELARHRRQVGVITFTNAARDEILRRVSHAPIFHVATIHSFAWTLIEGRTGDIRAWLLAKIPDDLAEKKDKLTRARTDNSKANYSRDIAGLEARFTALKAVRKFTYNPNGDNIGTDALSHDEVIKMASAFLMSKEALQRIVLARYPFLLIDESQDTMKELMDALLVFEGLYRDRFALGLFGDTMQRIYPQGKPDLAAAIPETWARPEKQMNHRSRERIIRLANAVRQETDGGSQRARADKEGGYAIAYILPASTPDKLTAEMAICADMADRTGDADWTDPETVKKLTVERHMAAERLGFAPLFAAIDPVTELKTGFKDGTLGPLRLFTERILPLVEAQNAGNQFAAMAILRAHSPLLDKSELQGTKPTAQATMTAVRDAVTSLMSCFKSGTDPCCGELLSAVAEKKLFAVPDALTKALALGRLAEDENDDDARSAAWRRFLTVQFSEISIYRQYAADETRFGTHQGVKGLEFPRVMVIADDNDLRFKGAASYEKLFGAKPASANDKKNAAEGKDTAFDRTRRLLYVTCTRAEESLALVIYSDDPAAVRQTLIDKKWFTTEEVDTDIN